MFKLDMDIVANLNKCVWEGSFVDQNQHTNGS